MTLGGRVVSVIRLAVKSLPAFPDKGECAAGIVSREGAYDFCNLLDTDWPGHSNMAKRAGQPGVPEYGANVPRPVD